MEPADKSFVDQYESIVKKHLSNPDFDVEMLCKEMGVSRAKLYRKVKAITNLSPAEVIRNIRLECAAEMLRTSGQTATEIAYLTGFGSYNHFSDYLKVYMEFLLKIIRINIEILDIMILFVQ